MGPCLSRSEPYEVSKAQAEKEQAAKDAAANAALDAARREALAKLDADRSSRPTNIARVSMSSEKAADNKGIARLSRANSRVEEFGANENAMGKNSHADGAPRGPKPKQQEEVWD